jgi:hypothetical protein
VRAGVDDAGDGFAVPIEDDEHGLAVRLVRLPDTDPRALERMAEDE